MLALVCSLGRLFTAIITNTLSRTVKGQVITLMIMVMILFTWSGTFSVSPSVEILENMPVMLVEFEPVRLAIMSGRRMD